jgi:aminoglycoside phosphotransferase (APT) family kinase protein
VIPAPTLAWLRRVLGRRRFDADGEPLGGSSHSNHRVHVEDGTEFLLRRFTDDERRDDPWYVAADEVAAFEALDGFGVPAPRLVAADARGSECDVPTLLVTWHDGIAADVEPPRNRSTFVRGLAEHLPTIHRAPLVRKRYEPYFASDGSTFGDLRPPSWTQRPALWERAIYAAATGAPAFEERFIHRDYHHGNTLWVGDRLTAIIDWTTGSSGPIGIDLAQMRMNLAWDRDLDLADAFLDAWREIADDPDAHHPYWDVLDAVDWLGDGEPGEEHTPERLARFEAYTERALAELG